MRHFHHMTKAIPAKAELFPDGHPGLPESIKGLVQNPVAVLQQHLQKDPQ